MAKERAIKVRQRRMVSEGGQRVVRYDDVLLKGELAPGVTLESIVSDLANGRAAIVTPAMEKAYQRACDERTKRAQEKAAAESEPTAA